jgi:hypothetical protein
VETEKKYQELKDVHASLDEVAGEKLGKEMWIHCKCKVLQICILGENFLKLF